MAEPRNNKRARYDDDVVTGDNSSATAAEGFFEALSEAGVTHCFVNLGSDHPAMLEAMIKAKQGQSQKFPRIITCPSELVALSAALGYSGEIKTGHNIKEMVNRALQFTISDPKGPAYLMAAREVLEEKVDRKWLEEEMLSPIVPSALPEPEVELIATTLINAKRPLIITGYLGRNINAPPLLEELCNKLPIKVVEMIGSDVCLRSDHEAYLGVTVTTHPAVMEADVILILDCDVPWIPTAGKPKKDRQHLNVADYASGFEKRAARYSSWRADLQSSQFPADDGSISVPYLTSRIREHVPQDTIFVMEAVTNAGLLIHNLNLVKPGSLVGSGAGGLGWGGGATMGVKMAKPNAFVCGIVGDGTYLFSQMESVYWIARRYEVPFMLIVLNNSGWNAPKVSALLVHKDGLSSKSNRKDLNLSFEPSPDYPGIAAAAGNAWGATVKVQNELDQALVEGIATVQGGRCAVIEVAVPSMWKET
ncbi:Thiamine pyrophosphate enzyme C-terminal TPP-binding [Penicillium macrosclerotiorum]|uniref:Thiamine pyrophosphate enzyme C-terminal TPP-binding n=1 Tax=Penicillium macrosclerotiorum TaxID=303699 RepID=UPI002549A861|nr:Thiamine pyrophosphate enzyme C-terminal TPP-binding [Penicillium macrosclerotiorum]KAJ5690147.1 Thiamine pyrophosphate enzyme C-terminal TPP-binding [Penicillium macrosclerotiorum]